MEATGKFCYGCATRHPTEEIGKTVFDVKGNRRWCCDKCAEKKKKAAKLKTVKRIK